MLEFVILPSGKLQNTEDMAKLKSQALQYNYFFPQSKDNLPSQIYSQIFWHAVLICPQSSQKETKPKHKLSFCNTTIYLQVEIKLF